MLAILSTKSSLKLVELVETPDPVQVGHTFNEIFFETLAILSTKSLKLVELVETPDPVQVGHTFNEIFFETLAILSTKSLKLVELVETPDPVQVGHTFDEIFFETRGTRGNSLRKLRTFEVFLDFFGGCRRSGEYGTTFFKFHETYLIYTLNFSNF